jgi:hypothetical protein
MCDQPPNNPKHLRVIETARTEKTINKAARDGFRPLVKPVMPGEEIQFVIAVLQHKQTGEIHLSGDMRDFPDSDHEMVIPYMSYYPYKFPTPYAAYLLPADLAEGERVWLEDVIEDIVAVWGNQGYRPRLKHAEATWTGNEFIIHFDPETDAPHLIG